MMFQVFINNLGDRETIKTYNKELLKYFATKNISDLSKKRLEQGNGLRILDSKDVEDQSHFENAPHIDECISNASRNKFEELLKSKNLILDDNLLQRFNFLELSMNGIRGWLEDLTITTALVLNSKS